MADPRGRPRRAAGRAEAPQEAEVLEEVVLEEAVLEEAALEEAALEEAILEEAALEEAALEEAVAEEAVESSQAHPTTALKQRTRLRPGRIQRHREPTRGGAPRALPLLRLFRAPEDGLRSCSRW